MEFQPVPNTCEVVCHFIQDLQKVVNIFHFHKDGGWSAADLGNLAQAVMDWWIADIKPLVNQSVKLESVSARDLSTESGASALKIPAVDQIGTGDVSTLPNSATLAVSLRTGKNGRSYRGRSYFVGIDPTEVDKNTVSQSYTTAVQTAYNALRSTVAPSLACEMCVVSRYHNKARRDTAETNTVTAVTIDPTVDSQRRRLPGRGR